MSRTRTMATCQDCKEYRTHQARGLCKVCWNRHRRNGTLDKFSRVRHKWIEIHDGDDIPLTGGRWVNVGGIQRWHEDAA